jgi:beta-1,4-mannosyltransferase
MRTDTTRALDGVRVAIVVLGDFGRSPRMLYQALACADHGAEVAVLATVETPVPLCISAHPAISVWALPICRSLVRHRFGAIRAALRALIQGAALFWLLAVRIRRPDVFVVQNPPSMPAVAVAAIAARLRRSRLIVDWHNFGWKVLSLKTAHGPILRLSRWVELAAAHGAHAHLCVSEPMSSVLATECEVTGAVAMYDRPAARFTPALRSLPAPAVVQEELDRNSARPLIAIAPGSWTLDEDTDVLIDAIARYDAHPEASPLLLLMSGDGPRRAAFESRIQRMRMSRNRIRFVWVPFEDYPALLAHADIGVSLHHSASGVDLPMKMADMRGSGLPVLALSYACLRDELRDDAGVRFFSTAAELEDALIALSRDPARGRPAVQTRVTWEEEWRRTCLPLLRRQIRRNTHGNLAPSYEPIVDGGVPATDAAVSTAGDGTEAAARPASRRR